MMLIPQVLFDNPAIKTILRDGNSCILTKELDEPILKKEGYISNHVISIVLAGEQRITNYEEKTITVRQGEVLFIPRGMYYITDLLPKAGKFKSILFYFDDALIETFVANAKIPTITRTNVPDHLKFKVIPTIQLFADSIISIYQNNQIRNKNFLNLKTLELLYLLNGLAKEQAFANFLFQLTLPKKRNIKSFMAENFDKPLKVEDYAYLTGRSLSSFRRDFKTYYDCTPQQWLKEKRLDKAQALLDTNEKSVAAVAHEVGYENISYLIKAFKERVGRSPKQYKLYRNRDLL